MTQTETLLMKYNGDINRFCDKVKRELKQKPLFNNATSIKVYPNDKDDLLFSVTVVGEGLGVMLKNNGTTKIEVVDGFFDCIAQGATFDVELVEAYYENDEAVLDVKLTERVDIETFKESKMSNFEKIFREKMSKSLPRHFASVCKPDTLFKESKSDAQVEGLKAELKEYITSQGFIPQFTKDAYGADFAQTGVNKDLGDLEFQEKMFETVEGIKEIILKHGFEIDYSNPKCEVENSGQGLIISGESWGWYTLNESKIKESKELKKQGKYQIDNPDYYSALPQETVSRLDKLIEKFMDIDLEIQQKYPNLKFTGKPFWGVTSEEGEENEYFASDCLTDEDLDKFHDKVGEERFDKELTAIFNVYHPKFIKAIQDAGFTYVDAETEYIFKD